MTNPPWQTAELVLADAVGGLNTLVPLDKLLHPDGLVTWTVYIPGFVVE